MYAVVKFDFRLLFFLTHITGTYMYLLTPTPIKRTCIYNVFKEKGIIFEFYEVIKYGQR